MRSFKVVTVAPWCRVTAAKVWLVLMCVGGPAGAAAADNPLSLDEALAIAVRDSAQLAAQRSAITAAAEATAAARELPDPKLRLALDNFPVDGPDRYSLTRDFMTMRRIGVAQEFPRGEKRELKGRRAEHQLAREEAMLGDTLAALRREVATAWMDRYYAEQMARAVDEVHAETTLQRDAVQAVVAASRAAAIERLTLDVTLQTLLDRRAEFGKQAARAQAMLARWLGDAARRPLAPLPAVPAMVTLAAAAADSHTQHHPHLETLARQIDVAQSEADLARAATRPDWGVELSYAQRGAPYANMLNVQVSIDLPLFASRRQNRDTAARMAQLEQARALREDALRLHLAEAAAARSDWEAATARLRRFDESLLPLAQERIALALAAYRSGGGALAAVLEARRMALDLRLQKLQLAAELGRARAQLIYFQPGEAVK